MISIKEIRVHSILCRAPDIAALRLYLWSNSGHHADALGIRGLADGGDEGTVCQSHGAILRS